MRHLFIKALLVSLLIHGIVLSIFFFTFPVIHESFRPVFIFRGSVLTQQDVRGDLGSVPGVKKVFSGDDSPDILKDGSAGAFLTSLPRYFFKEDEGKPVFLSSSRGVEVDSLYPRTKIILKSMFETPFVDEKSSVDVKEDDLTRYGIEPYEPLTLPH